MGRQRRCVRLLDDADGEYYAAAQTGRIGAYLCSPAFAQLYAAHRAAVNVFTAIWTAINCAALWCLLGRWSLPSLLFLPIPFEIISGNVHLLYGVAIVVGFRWAASWALMFITKVTPGIGVLWFLVRREWRQFALALGVTAGSSRCRSDRSCRLGAVDRAAPGRPSGRGAGDARHAGLVSRGAAAAATGRAAALVVFAALTDRRWLVPFAVVLALPVVWLNGLAVLAAVVPLWQARLARVPRAGSAAPAAASTGMTAATATTRRARSSTAAWRSSPA